MSSSEPTTPLPQTRQSASTPQPGDLSRSRPFPNQQPTRLPAPPSRFQLHHHSDPLPDHVSLTQLLNLSLKTPDYGVVNFRSLYVLLEYLINRMNVAHESVDLTGRPSRELLREAARNLPVDSGALETSPVSADGVIDFRDQRNLTRPVGPVTKFLDQRRIATLEQKVSVLRLQLDAFHELPTNERLIEKAEEQNSARQDTGQKIGKDDQITGTTTGPVPRIVANISGSQSQLGSRLSGPMTEAWQVAQLIKRMDAAEQSLEKAFSLIDQLLQGVGKIQNLRNSLMNYIGKWMLNPDDAFQDALNGGINEDADGNEATGSETPQHINKLPLVTWPALRAVLVDLQHDDEKLLISAGRGRSLSPLIERTDDTSTRATEMSPVLIIHDQISTSSQASTDRSPGKSTEGVVDPFSAKHTDGTFEDEATAHLQDQPDVQTDPNTDVASPARTDIEETARLALLAGATPGSTPRSTPLLHRFDVIFRGSPTESPPYLGEPDGEVLDSLVQIGRLVRLSHKFEARLAHVEEYLNGLAHKKGVVRMSDGLRNDMDEFRKSLSTVAGLVSSQTEMLSERNRNLANVDGTTDNDETFDESALQDELENSGKESTLRLLADQQAQSINGLECTLAQFAEVRGLLDMYKNKWEHIQNRVNMLHKELGLVSVKLKDQANKLSASPSRNLIQPQQQQNKSERLLTNANGPTRSEFEIFCRACAENFEMIEVRLTDLENQARSQQAKSEALQVLTGRLQRDKADTDAVSSQISPKADMALLENKVDRPQFVELANFLKRRLLEMNGDLHQQGDHINNNIRSLEDRLLAQLNPSDYEQMLEETDKGLDSINKRVLFLEKVLEADSAAGTKRPLRAYTCVSCDKPVDPTPNERPSGWPHAYVTASVRPHLEYNKCKMIQSGNHNPKLEELKYRSATLEKQFQRHIREQECIEFKQVKNHFGHSDFPHCDHNELRSVGGHHTQLASKDYVVGKNPRKHIEDRLNGFVKKNSFQIQFPLSARTLKELPASAEKQLAPTPKPKSADSGKPATTEFDAKNLEPGPQKWQPYKSKPTDQKTSDPKTISTSPLVEGPVIENIRESVSSPPLVSTGHLLSIRPSQTKIIPSVQVDGQAVPYENKLQPGQPNNEILMAEQPASIVTVNIVIAEPVIPNEFDIVPGNVQNQLESTSGLPGNDGP